MKGGDKMNLLDLREQLKAIDATLDEMKAAVDRAFGKAGGALVKADSVLTAVMGEGLKKKPSRRGRKAGANGAAPEQEQVSSIQVSSVPIVAKAKRGRKPKQAKDLAEEQGNSEATDEVSV